MLSGIDVSIYQGQPDWQAVAAAGKAFAIAKASEGLAISDPTFAYNWQAIKAAGMVRGAYHYLYTGNDPVVEADFFLSHIPALEPGDLLALDVEIGGGDLSQRVRACLDRIEARAGFKPLLYCNPDYAENHLSGAGLSAFPLWLADLSRSRVSCGQWASIAIRQYDFHGRVAGIAGDVDLSELARDLAGLKALGKPSPTPPPAPTTYEVTSPGALKSQPNHTSPAAIDPHGNPVFLELGAVVIPTGPVQQTDDAWLPVKLPAPSPVHGFFARKGLGPDTDV